MSAPTVPGGDRAWILRGAGLLDEVPPLKLPDPATLLAIDDEMREFAQRVAGEKFTVEGKVNALANALTEPTGLGLQYDAAATLSARDAFKARRVNCLSYTMLYVALAREVGINANFNDVQVPLIWGLQDESFILYRHVNARVTLGANYFTVVDLAPGEFDPRFSQRLMSDQLVRAQFFNNRAVELRVAGRAMESLQYQLRAIDLAPHRTEFWENLSQIYRSQGELRAAKAAVDVALSMSQYSETVFSNAAGIYADLGETDLATKFDRRAEGLRRKNPYYHYRLALNALERGDDRTAYASVQRALSLNMNEDRFYFLKGMILQRRGDTALAKQYMQTALELNRNAERGTIYRDKIKILDHG
ncbi:MAG: transglutaminase domain-containing protein [Pseudomonadota bacterium]|nr:transglutaminase domain-containing protein [Pseudomonadota bacterium]